MDIDLTIEYWKDGEQKTKETRNKQFTQEKAFKKKRSQRLYLGGAKPMLGGSSAVRGLTGGKYSDGFHGCISRLYIRKREGRRTFGSEIDIKTNENNSNLYTWDNVYCKETCTSA